MALCPVRNAHPALGALGSRRELRFFELADGGEAYAAAALAEHPDCLELHLYVLRFGPATVRALRADLEELKVLARTLGKARIIGLRTEDGPEPDPRWQKFTRLFGFTRQRVLQTAELTLE